MENKKTENTNLQVVHNFVLFKTKTGKVNIDVFFKDDTLWLTQKLMSILFEKGRSTITEHLKNIFETNSVLNVLKKEKEFKYLKLSLSCTT